MDIAANLNDSTCIQSANYIGHTLYVNICTHSSVSVPWGNSDWLGFLVVAVLAALVAAFVGGMALAVLRDNL